MPKFRLLSTLLSGALVVAVAMLGSGDLHARQAAKQASGKAVKSAKAGSVAERKQAKGAQLRSASVASSREAKLSRHERLAARRGDAGARRIAGKRGQSMHAGRHAESGKVAVRRLVKVNGRTRVVTTYVAPVAAVASASAWEAPAERQSIAQKLGLRSTQDDLDLKSSVALVVDQETNEVLFQKNTHAVLPIASITKLMTALVVLESQQSLGEWLTISDDDRDTEKGSRSRLQIGTQLSREEMLRLALMSSENRAASALGRHYPGGLPAFVQAMNRKARELGMSESRFVDSTGLSSLNVSSAVDLTRLVNATYRHPLIREFSVTPQHDAYVAGRSLQFVNTNRLVRASGDWEIGLQKTGYISEAGRCLVMQARVHGRPVVMVFLDSVGKQSRFADAVRVKSWLESALRPHNVTTTAFGNRPI